MLPGSLLADGPFSTVCQHATLMLPASRLSRKQSQTPSVTTQDVKARHLPVPAVAAFSPGERKIGGAYPARERTWRISFGVSSSRNDSGTAVTAIVSPTALKTSIE